MHVREKAQKRLMLSPAPMMLALRGTPIECEWQHMMQQLEKLVHQRLSAPPKRQVQTQQWQSTG